MSEEKKLNTKEANLQKFNLKEFFSYKWVVKNIPFFLFLSFLAVLFIYNGHNADKLARKIAVTEKHIKEMQYEYKTLKSEVIFRSKASELVKAVEPLGLKELTAPPILIADSAEVKN